LSVKRPSILSVLPKLCGRQCERWIASSCGPHCCSTASSRRSISTLCLTLVAKCHLQSQQHCLVATKFYTILRLILHFFEYHSHSSTSIRVGLRTHHHPNNLNKQRQHAEDTTTFHSSSNSSGTNISHIAKTDLEWSTNTTPFLERGTESDEAKLRGRSEAQVGSSDGRKRGVSYGAMAERDGQGGGVECVCEMLVNVCVFHLVVRDGGVSKRYKVT
jgi:hypothetical protein